MVLVVSWVLADVSDFPIVLTPTLCS